MFSIDRPSKKRRALPRSAGGKCPSHLILGIFRELVNYSRLGWQRGMKTASAKSTRRSAWIDWIWNWPISVCGGLGPGYARAGAFRQGGQGGLKAAAGHEHTTVEISVAVDVPRNT